MPTPAADGEAPVWTARPRPRRRRLLVRIGLALLGCTAVFFGQYYYRCWRAGRELQAAIEEVDRRDPGWRLEELEAKRAAVPDAQNGAFVVLAAARHFPKDWNWVGQPIYDELHEIPPAAQLHPRHVAELQAVLKALAPAVQEARKLVDYPKGRYRITWADDFFGTLIPHIDHMRGVVHLLEADALLRSQDGDADGALASCRAMLNAARSLGDEPLAITQLVHIACRAVAGTTAERVLAQGQPSERALADLQQPLEKEASELLMRFAVRGERAGHHHLMMNVAAGKLTLSQISSDKKRSGFWGGIGEWLVRPRYTESHAWALRYLTDFIEAVDKPGAEQEARLQELQARIKEAPPVAALLMPAIERVIAAEKRNVASLRCAVVGLAAERYRRKAESWPKRLDDLVTAGLLKAVPADPYDGKPLRLRQAKDGLVIYSVGPEGKIDGTALDDGRFDPEEIRVEFRLWDVASRRQPPPPPRREEIPPPEEEPGPEGP
jgi:hypothetical protein